MINKIILVGRVGKDPEVKTLSNNNKNASFSLATSESYKDKDGNKVENTEWHNISIWGNPVAFVEKYIKKGDLVYLEGKVKTRSWDDKDGNKKYITEIIAHEIKSLSHSKQSKNEDELDSL